MRVPYLVQRGNQFYFQLRLPVDVQEHFQCTQLKKSLKTTDRRQAATKIKVISAEIEKAFFMIRTGILTPQLIQQIITDVKENLLEMHRRHGRKPGTNKTEQYRDTAGQVQTQIQQRDYSGVAVDAANHLERRGVTVDTNSREFMELCDGLLQTKRRVFEVMAERESGNYNNRYDNGLSMRVQERKFRLSELIVDYTAHSGGGVRFQQRRRDNFKKVLDVIGDVFTHEVTKDLIQTLHNELSQYPSNRFKNPYAGKTLEDCRLLPGFQCVSTLTQRDTWVDVKSLLQYGYENEKYNIKRNYSKDGVFKVKKGKGVVTPKRAVYDQEDLANLFTGLSQEVYVKQPHRYWIPLVGLFQGMRQNEICQLFLDDIFVDSVSGLDCIRITDDPNRNQILEKPNLKSVKNDSSRRTIPIHPSLVKLGFLEYVESRRKLKHKRLWENLQTPAVDYYDKAGNYSHYVSKWFCGTFRKNHILNEPELKPFHSLRHTFINWHFQNVKSNELDFSAVKGLVGHVDTAEQQLIGKLLDAETWTTYSQELNVKRLYNTLCLFDPGVDLGLLKRRK